MRVAGLRDKLGLMMLSRGTFVGIEAAAVAYKKHIAAGTELNREKSREQRQGTKSKNEKKRQTETQRTEEPKKRRTEKTVQQNWT